MITSAMLKANARELIRSNMPKLILVGAIYILVATIITEIQFRLTIPVGLFNAFNDLRLYNITMEEFINSISTFGMLLALLLMHMLPTISIGYHYYCIKITRKQDGDYNDLLVGFSMFVKVISLSFLTSLFVTLWSLLFIFPGIVAHYKYRQVYYILLDDPTKSVMDCIRESKRLMNTKKLDLFLIDLSFLGWHFLSSIVQGFFIIPFVSIWITPYINLTRAAYYNHLIKEVTV